MLRQNDLLRIPFRYFSRHLSRHTQPYSTRLKNIRDETWNQEAIHAHYSCIQIALALPSFVSKKTLSYTCHLPCHIPFLLRNLNRLRSERTSANNTISFQLQTFLSNSSYKLILFLRTDTLNTSCFNSIFNTTVILHLVYPVLALSVDHTIRIWEPPWVALGSKSN